MKTEISKPLAAEILRIYEEAEWIEGLTTERPRDQLTRLVDALVPHMQDAEGEERIEREKLDDVCGAPGDPYYYEEEEEYPYYDDEREDEPPDYEEQDPEPPAPADDEQMPF